MPQDLAPRWGPTPAATATGGQYATLDFVRGLGPSMSGFGVVTETTLTVTISHLGKFLYAAVSGPTYTLPLASTFPQGAVLTISAASGPVTINTTSPNIIYQSYGTGAQGGSVTSMTLVLGDTLTLTAAPEYNAWAEDNRSNSYKPRFWLPPTFPTAAAGTNTTDGATTAFVQAAITALALGTASAKNTGTSSGNVPLLDGSGKLATTILPSIAVTDTFVVASQSAMLALTAERGDLAIRSDLNKSFVLSTDSPGTLADWKELLTPTDQVLSVAGLTGAIAAAAMTAALDVATTSLKGLLSAADKTKLDGIASGATANSTDAALRTRSSHTGTQAWSTIDTTPTTLAGYGITDAAPLGKIANNTQTASYTLALSDAGKRVRMNSASANNLTVPNSSSVAFAADTTVDGFQVGAGQTTIVAASGVTINSKGGKLKSTGQYSGWTLSYVGSNVWDLVGDITT